MKSVCLLICFVFCFCDVYGGLNNDNIRELLKEMNISISQNDMIKAKETLDALAQTPYNKDSIAGYRTFFDYYIIVQQMRDFMRIGDTIKASRLYEVIEAKPIPVINNEICHISKDYYDYLLFMYEKKTYVTDSLSKIICQMQKQTYTNTITKRYKTSNIFKSNKEKEVTNGIIPSKLIKNIGNTVGVTWILSSIHMVKEQLKDVSLYFDLYGKLATKPDVEIKRNEYLSTVIDKSNLLFIPRQAPDGKWGYVNKMGNGVIPFEFDYAEPFSYGIAIVKKGELYGFIDVFGNSTFSK